MKVRCEYCGNYLSDTEERCPNCMAPNEHLKRVGNAVPQTIEELKLWYKEHNLPSEETTRFFIGKDIKESRAFGIYYDDKKGNLRFYCDTILRFLVRNKKKMIWIEWHMFFDFVVYIDINRAINNVNKNMGISLLIIPWVKMGNLLKKQKKRI